MKFGYSVGAGSESGDLELDGICIKKESMRICQLGEVWSVADGKEKQAGKRAY